MRCRIERNVQAAADPYGHPAPPDWQVLHAALPCWLSSTAKREVADGDKVAAVEDLRVLVPAGTDVTERDRVNGVVDRLGNTVDGRVMQIDGVVRRQGHLELLVTAVG